MSRANAAAVAALTGQGSGDLALRDMEAARRAAEINARLIAAEMYDLGIDVDCTGSRSVNPGCSWRNRGSLVWG